jgi:hypothetical protein
VARVAARSPAVRETEGRRVATKGRWASAVGRLEVLFRGTEVCWEGVGRVHSPVMFI